MELFEIEVWRVILAHRIRTARKYDTFYSAVNFRNMIKGVDLAVNIELPDTARYQLRKLRAEVKNEDFFLHGQR